MKTLFALILAIGALKSGLTLIERAESTNPGSHSLWERATESAGTITPRPAPDSPETLPPGVVALP